MTLIAAIGCNDGIVLAADSSASDPLVGTQQLVRKIKRIPTQPILYGGSGDGGLLQKIDECLLRFVPRNNLKNIIQEIKRCIMPDIKESRDLHVPYPESFYRVPPVSILLFACIVNRTPCIIEIDKDCRDTCYGKEYGWFCAIGSGKPLAQAIFSPYLHAERDLSLGKILAYRVLHDSIKLASGGIDRPIHIHTLDLDGNVIELNPVKLGELSDNIQLWHELEIETIGKLVTKLSGQVEEVETELDIPKPT